MQNVSKSYDVIIIGAGAAGLICAFAAAKRGKKVLILEKTNKIGKKILMSGGGRCNFTNTVVESENYICSNPHFCKAALKCFTQWDFISLIESHNIEYEERKHGQLFCKGSSKDILDMLLLECNKANVVIKTNCNIKNITSTVLEQSYSEADSNTYYQVSYAQGNNAFNLSSQSLVVATGGLSISKLGGSGLGYDIAKQFNLSIIAQRAGLVPFMFSDLNKLLCERLSGLALEVEVSCNGHLFTENLLFTHRGISGPVMLQISNYWYPGDKISINLLPYTHTSKWLLQEKSINGKALLRTILNKKLAKALVVELQSLWWPHFADKPLSQFSDKQLTDIGEYINCWQIKPSATEGYRTAEVTLGGINTDNISSKTMAAKQHQGLYFVGEVLDVTGHLGGFNFQWAWSSGYSAGLFV